MTGGIKSQLITVALLVSLGGPAAATTGQATADGALAPATPHADPPPNAHIDNDPAPAPELQGTLPDCVEDEAAAASPTAPPTDQGARAFERDASVARTDGAVEQASPEPGLHPILVGLLQVAVGLPVSALWMLTLVLVPGITALLVFPMMYVAMGVFFVQVYAMPLVSAWLQTSIGNALSGKNISAEDAAAVALGGSNAAASGLLLGCGLSYLAVLLGVVGLDVACAAYSLGVIVLAIVQTLHIGIAPAIVYAVAANQPQDDASTEADPAAPLSHDTVAMAY
jgi:hypothetical protein